MKSQENIHLGPDLGLCQLPTEKKISGSLTHWKASLKIAQMFLSD